MCKNNVVSVLLFVIAQVLCKSNSLPTGENGVWTTEVPFGENVVLQCQSNDEDHNFEFWVVENQQVLIGPSNNHYDIRKFKYHILSGNLTIRVSIVCYETTGMKQHLLHTFFYEIFNVENN